MHGGAGFFVEGRRFSDPKVNGPIEIAVLLVDSRVENDVTIAVEELRKENMIADLQDMNYTIDRATNTWRDRMT